MAIIRKSDLKRMGPEERAKKLSELQRAMLELRGEGRKDKAKPLRKAIAKLLTMGSIAAARESAKAQKEPAKAANAPHAAKAGPAVVASVEKRK